MIIATFFRDSNDNLTGFDCKGHADSDDYGHDVVCAAVSALVINTVNSIETFTDDHFECTSDEKNGGDLTLKIVDKISSESKLLLNSLLLGLEAVKTSNDDNFIKIAFEEV